jgi:protein involved in polysaccharide export with SLBB domain
VDVLVRPWGIEVWAPGAKAAGAQLPKGVVLSPDAAGTRLRLERPGTFIRGVRHGASQVEILVEGGGERGGQYHIGIGDVITLAVYKNQDLTGDLTVGPDGNITVPLLGVVAAAGRTESELAEDVRGALSKDYLVDPQVSLSVKTYQSQFVHVTGSVSRAARVPVKPSMTFKDILSEAGVALAPGQVVMLSRAGSPPAPLSQTQLESPGMVPQDGDVLDVQERGYVVVNGEVRRPGRHVLTSGMTLLEAIALTEGLTDWASKKDVRILRRDEADGPQREVLVNLRDVESGRAKDPVLQSGDVVLVGRRFL